MNVSHSIFNQIRVSLFDNAFYTRTSIDYFWFDQNTMLTRRA